MRAFEFLERDGYVYPTVVAHLTTDKLMKHIKAKTRKGSDCYTDAFRGYRSLKCYGKRHIVNHAKSLVDRSTKNHINDIEGFWRYAKHILYNYHGVSKYHFPMYLREIEYRFNHCKGKLFKQFIRHYFG